MVDCGRILATSGNKFMVRSMDCTCPQLWQHPLPPAEPPRHYPPVRQVLRSHCGPKPQAQWTWRTWRATPPAKAEIHGPIMSLRKPFLLRFTSCFRCSKKCSQHLTTSHNQFVTLSSGSEVHQFDQDPRQENGTYCIILLYSKVEELGKSHSPSRPRTNEMFGFSRGERSASVMLLAMSDTCQKATQAPSCSISLHIYIYHHLSQKILYIVHHEQVRYVRW